jgi:hypothetical protein
MTVGINAYVSSKDWPPKPTWMRQWFEDRTYRFQRAVLKTAEKLAAALTAPPGMFAGYTFDVSRGVFATNAVKVYVPEAEGKRADQLDPALYDEHRPQWRRELHALADPHVLPHVIIIFGNPFWEHAWQAFHPNHHDWTGAVRVTSFRSAGGDVLHRANRVALDAGGQPHDLLLVKLRHPAGRSREGSVRWLLARPAFRELVGLPTA